MNKDESDKLEEFMDELKADEKINFLVEYLKSDQLYPEFSTEVS